MPSPDYRYVAVRQSTAVVVVTITLYLIVTNNIIIFAIVNIIFICIVIGARNASVRQPDVNGTDNIRSFDDVFDSAATNNNNDR